MLISVTCGRASERIKRGFKGEWKAFMKTWGESARKRKLVSARRSGVLTQGCKTKTVFSKHTIKLKLLLEHELMVKMKGCGAVKLRCADLLKLLKLPLLMLGTSMLVCLVD